jgi:hypothetical protein
MAIKIFFFPKHFIAMPAAELFPAELFDSVRNPFSPPKLSANFRHYNVNA